MSDMRPVFEADRRVTHLPGQNFIDTGLDDLANRRETPEALLVSIGAPRLRRLGLTVVHPFLHPERRLYDHLRRDHGDNAHSRYNALIRRLVSFERAAECVR